MQLWKRNFVVSIIGALVISIVTIYLYLTQGIFDIIGMKSIVITICVVVVFLFVLLSYFSWKYQDQFPK